MIAVIDYGVGNLFSLCRSLEAIGQNPVVTGDPETLRKADRLFLPGVGAFAEALGDLKGVERFGDSIIPMDEALILSAVDLSGRGMLCWDVALPTEKVGDFDTELAKEFWLAFTRRANLTLHLRMLAGENSHHILEGVFKAAARSLRKAVAVTGDRIPSTKGVLV